jgi:predicted phosphodiesterase
MKRASVVLPILIGAFAVVAAIIVFGIVLHARNSGEKEQTNQLVFAVIGDTENHGDVFQAMLTDAKARGATLILHTGDISGNGSPAEFQAMKGIAQNVGLPLYAAIGNHDMEQDGSGATFRNVYNDLNFAVQVGTYRFVMLDNADRTVGFSSSTLSWLKNELKQHPQSRYILAFHRPFNLPLMQFTGDDETAASRASNNKFLSLLDQSRIAAIFTGHLHLYLPYQINHIPAYVTGGGGGAQQHALDALAPQGQHYLLVHLNNGNLDVEVIPMQPQDR